MPNIKSFRPKLQSFISSASSSAPAGKFQVLKLVPLGGVGDVTKNMYVYEYGDDIVIVDCGLGFPDEDMLGVDLVIPDVTYLKDKKSKIRGIVISHGHEDHIGGLPYVWSELDCPIYAQPLAAGFIQSKFTEHNLPKDKIQVLNINSQLDLGAFHISFYRASHSVPDSTGIIIETPIGRIIHQPDFKLDWTPVNGEVTDVGKVALAGEKGVLFMLIDGLGIERHGYTMSELSIQSTFAEIEEKTKGKLVITVNSSNITRMQQIINVAVKSNRKIAICGRSMENNFQVARDLGYLNVPPGLVIPQDEIKRNQDRGLIVIIAGSQGQPTSALTRAANNAHKFVTLKQGDGVIFSANPIPSSELSYYALVDKLTKMNLDVYYSDIQDNLHVSGHAAAEEIKLMVNLAKPEYVMPIGSTIRGLKTFSNTMQDMGFKADHVILPDNGNIIEITPHKVEIKGRIEAKNVYVDGLGVGDVGNIVLRDRQVLATEGIVLVLVPVDSQNSKVAGDIDVMSRGFTFEQGPGSVLDEAKQLVVRVLGKDNEQIHDWRFTRKEIEETLEKFLYQSTQRRPMILPIVVEV